MLSSGFRKTAAIFGVLHNRELRAFWFSDWVSDAGSFVTFIALALYVNQLTGSPAAIGLALGLRSVPWFTIGPFAGVLADRLDRRKVMIGSNLARAGLVALLPFTTSLWQVYVIALASATFGPLFRSARSATLPLVAPEGRLVPALAVIETTHQVLHTVGPALGGLVVFLVGAREAFFVDSASFVLASVFLLVLSPRGRPERERRSAVHELSEGVRGLVASPSVKAYALVNAALSLGYGGLIALLVPYVRDELRSPGGYYGIVLAAIGLGTVLTSLVIASRDDRHPRGPWAMASVAGMAVFVAILAKPGFFPLLPIALLAGIGDAGASIPMSATMAEVLPDVMRGRAYSAVTAFTELAAAIGSIGFAWLGEPGHLGVVTGMALAAGVGAALGLAALAGGGAAAINARERIRLSGHAPSAVSYPDSNPSAGREAP
jgi:NRE family putative nickel resistance protein-like MFS transporter